VFQHSPADVSEVMNLTGFCGHSRAENSLIRARNININNVFSVTLLFQIIKGNRLKVKILYTYVYGKLFHQI
jgi:hypothetical protein